MAKYVQVRRYRRIFKGRIHRVRLHYRKRRVTRSNR